MNNNIKQIQSRFIEEVWNKGNLAVAHELLGPTVVVRSMGRDTTGFEGVAQLTGTLRSAFSNLNLKVNEQIGEGEYVVARWTATGTNDGSLFGFKPTGKKISVEGHTVDRIHDGKIVSTFTSIDAMELLLQVGVEPRLDTRKAVSQRMFAEVWSSGKFQVMEEVVANDVVVGTRGEKGHDAMKSRIKAFRDAIPDLTVEVLTQIAEGDKVISTWQLRGHHRGALMGIPATGRFVNFNGSSVERIVDGKIKETNMVIDVLELLFQLGATVQPSN